MPVPAISADPGAAGLPELAGVHWRARVDDRRLRRMGWVWTGWTLAHTIPFVAVAVLLMLVQPLAVPVALISIIHAWIIPELYAQRGANVVRPRRPRQFAPGTGPAPGAERVAVGLLGDLVDHRARALYADTGLLLERGRLGIWLVGQAGALLVRSRGRRVHCYCVGVKEHSLPPSDRVAHLLLALRADEQGFATVANMAFCGARWRVRRRLDRAQRPALEAAADVAAGGLLSAQKPAAKALACRT